MEISDGYYVDIYFWCDHPPTQKPLITEISANYYVISIFITSDAIA